MNPLETRVGLITVQGIEAQVCSDIAYRQQIGIKKYGVTVAENNLTLREWLHHAYQECLDQAVYLRRAIAELDKSLAEKAITDYNEGRALDTLEDKPKPHNPDNLESPGEGYRFLDEDEVGALYDRVIAEIEKWSISTKSWDSSGWVGFLKAATFRTTLTRAELAKRRGL